MVFTACCGGDDPTPPSPPPVENRIILNKAGGRFATALHPTEHRVKFIILEHFFISVKSGAAILFSKKIPWFREKERGEYGGLFPTSLPTGKARHCSVRRIASAICLSNFHIMGMFNSFLISTAAAIPSFSGMEISRMAMWGRRASARYMVSFPSFPSMFSLHTK